MNAVCYEQVFYLMGLLWTGLLWTWSVPNDLLRVVCYERVCFEREPKHKMQTIMSICYSFNLWNSKN